MRHAMHDRSDPLMRIETARLELGHTDVRPSVARALVVTFLFVVSIVPLAQLFVEPALIGRMLTAARQGLTQPVETSGDSSLAGVFARNRVMLSSIQQITDLVADDSLATRLARPVVQYVLSAGLGAGTSQVHHGRGDWLFFSPDLAYVTGPGFLEPGQLRRRSAAADSLRLPVQPDPRPALFDLHTQLSQRNIALVVMPTPVKPSVDWEQLASRDVASASLPENPSLQRIAEQLRDRGVLVFDVGAVLQAEKLSSRSPQYLATDTHWRPETSERVAARLAEFLTSHDLLGPPGPPLYSSEAIAVTNRGDISRLLGLGPSSSRFGPESVTARQIRTPDDRLWRPDPTSEILLLGDSFTNVYALEAMGWGTGAGLAAQLSFELQRPVDRIAQNDEGASASRELLARELRRGRDRLDGKRVVVLQFAAREFGFGDWRLVDLTASPPPVATSFIRPTSGVQLDVEGVVVEIGRIPRPGTVPYKDHIVAVHLSDVTTVGSPSVDGRDALVYLWSMQDDELTTAADLNVGDRIQLHLEPWANVAADLDGINRDEVLNPVAQTAEPWWGIAEEETSP